MALSDEQRRDFLHALRADDEFRAEVRREVLTEQLLELPQRVTELELRLTTKISDLAEQTNGLTTTVANLAEQTNSLTTTVANLAEQIAVFTLFAQQASVDIGDLKGYRLESNLERHPGAYLGRVVRHPRRLDEHDIYDLVDGSGDDSDDDIELLHADLIARGTLRSDGEPTYTVVEASWRVHIEDVERAARRARILASLTHSRVLAVALSQDDPGEVMVTRARALGVTLLRVGETAPLVDATPVPAA